jgi:dihydrofolate synthase/folylpolyglutamate synthase
MSYRYEVGEYDHGLQGLTVHTPTGSYQHLQIPLLGVHQIENATLAIATLEILREAGYDWDEVVLRRGLRAVRWLGRLEVVGQEPTIVVDGAHNTDSMQKLLAALRTYFPMRQLIVVLGVLKNKDLADMVRTLAGVDAVVLTRVGNPRAVEQTVLAELFAQCAPNVRVYQAGRSSEAMDMALGLAGREDLVCATGSLYLAGEVLRWAAAHGDACAASGIEGVDHS